MSIYWKIDGEMAEIQGSIERARDQIEEYGYKIMLIEESRGSASYSFITEDFGETGKIKISVLPKNKSEVRGSPTTPDTKWMVENLQKTTSKIHLSSLLIKLLNMYEWQIETGIFKLSPAEEFDNAFGEKKIDWGWEKYGFSEAWMREKALIDLDVQKKIVYDNRTEEFEGAVSLIFSQILADGFFVEVFENGIGKVYPPFGALGGQPKNETTTDGDAVPTSPEDLKQKTKNITYCPKKGTQPYYKWQTIWRKIRGKVKGGSTIKELESISGVSAKTLSKIVKAGQAGLLD